MWRSLNLVGMATPVEVLERIAYLLERQHAETYKVRAFRRAAKALAAVDPSRVEALATEGRLRQIDGVGDTTAKVIEEVLAGRIPSYLATLEEQSGRGAEPSGPPAARRP